MLLCSCLEKLKLKKIKLKKPLETMVRKMLGSLLQYNLVLVEHDPDAGVLDDWRITTTDL